ncbi:MAG: hypothetical protein V4628_17540 [Pseudomonadota bacterium]
MKKSPNLLVPCSLAFMAIYAALLLGEVIGMTNTFLHLRNEIGVPIVLLRVCVFLLTIFPVAFFVARGVMRLFPMSGQRVVVNVAFVFTLFVGFLQIFVYSAETWSSSLMKILFVVAGLLLATSRPIAGGVGK